MTNKCENTPEMVSLIFDGSKSLWQSKSNISVKIADHTTCNVLEIIIINSESGVEAPRLFANKNILNLKVNQNEFEEKLAHQKEALIRRRMPVDLTLLSLNIMNELVAQYIVSRLEVSKTTSNDEFGIIFTTKDAVDDKSGEEDGIICPKPNGLVSFQVERTNRISMEEFRSKEIEFHNEKKEVEQHCKVALEHHQKAVQSTNSQTATRPPSRKLDPSTPLLPASFDQLRSVSDRPSRVGVLRHSVDDNRVMENTKFRQVLENLPTINMAATASTETESVVNEKILKKRVMHREKSIRSLIKGENINMLPNLHGAPSDTLAGDQIPLHTKSRNEGTFSATTGTSRSKRERVKSAPHPISKETSFNLSSDSDSDSDSSQSSYSSQSSDGHERRGRAKFARDFSDRAMNVLTRVHSGHIGGLKLVVRMNSTRGHHDKELFHRVRSRSSDSSPLHTHRTKVNTPPTALPPLPLRSLQPGKVNPLVSTVSGPPTATSDNKKEAMDALRDLCMSPRPANNHSTHNDTCAVAFASMQSPRPEPLMMPSRLGAALTIKTGLMSMVMSPMGSPSSPHKKQLQPLRLDGTSSPRTLNKKSPVSALDVSSPRSVLNKRSPVALDGGSLPRSPLSVHLVSPLSPSVMMQLSPLHAMTNNSTNGSSSSKHSPLHNRESTQHHNVR